MPAIKCRDEDKELQTILDQDHELLTEDQINPEDPRRWLLIKREMPVQGPGTGVSRWSIDFFFVDHEGVPTFVECKRFEDTRSRREVVGPGSVDPAKYIYSVKVRGSNAEFIQIPQIPSPPD
jgi:hypothetical protein